MLFLTGSLAASCSTSRDAASLYAPQDVSTLVVDALLMVGQRMPLISLMRTGRPDQDYSRNLYAELGASVQVIADSSGVTDTIPYAWYDTDQTAYRTLSGHRVKAQTRYTLEVRTNAGERLSAVTFTPPPLTVNDWVVIAPDGAVLRTLKTFAELGDAVYSAPENQITYAGPVIQGRFDRPDVLGFQVGLVSLDLDSGLVVDAGFLSEEDRADLPRYGSSPVFEATDNQVRLPWLAVYFAGRHNLRILALDRNTYDLVRSIPPNEGAVAFGGNVGDEFERPIFNVVGGIGLFGSAAADSIGFNVVRP